MHCGAAHPIKILSGPYGPIRPTLQRPPPCVQTIQKLLDGLSRIYVVFTCIDRYRDTRRHLADTLVSGQSVLVKPVT